MELFEKKSTRLRKRFKLWLPALLPVLICLLFLLGVQRTSRETILQEQQTLLQALEKSAVHTYALTGRYPENLDQLLTEYHITYDPEKFVVEYIPNAANLFPMISVIPLNQEGGSS